MPIRRCKAGFLRGPNRDDLPSLLESSPLYTFTYALYDGEFIKIGKTRRHPIIRLRSLQTGNARPLSLLAYTLSLTEVQAHSRLHRHRIRGEWFRPTEAVLKELKTWTWADPALLRGLTGALII